MKLFKVLIFVSLFLSSCSINKNSFHKRKYTKRGFFSKSTLPVKKSHNAKKLHPTFEAKAKEEIKKQEIVSSSINDTILLEEFLIEKEKTEIQQTPTFNFIEENEKIESQTFLPKGIKSKGVKKEVNWKKIMLISFIILCALFFLLFTLLGGIFIGVMFSGVVTSFFGQGLWIGSLIIMSTCLAVVSFNGMKDNYKKLKELKKAS